MEIPLNTTKPKASSREAKFQLLVDRVPTEPREETNPNNIHQPDEYHDRGRENRITLSCSHEDPYIMRQKEKDKQYEQHYKKWVSDQSPSQLRKLKELGLDQPKIGYTAKGAPKADFADSPLASYEPDIAALIDRDDEKHSERSTVPDVLEALRHLVAILISFPNTRLTVECLCLVLGLRAYDGASMTEIAGRHGITPAAVSKRCIKLTNTLAIRPSRAMQSLRARENHRDAVLKSNRELLP